MVEDRNAPERPRVEPEIIPPDRTQSTRRPPSFTEMGGTHRIYVTRLGPFGGALLMLIIVVLSAIAFLLLLGTVLIWLPVVAIIAIAAALSGLLRSRRW